MLSIKNWDNKTWISSKKYIQSFNIFLLKQKKLTKHSKILDIGCGRGKIMGSLSSKLKLINKPVGLDIESHKDFDKRIIFKKTNAIKYLKENKKKFDLILIKQTIHLFNLKDIKKILTYSYSSLNVGGIILILTLNTKNNEIPTFSLMKQKLTQSFKRDNLIWKKLIQLNIRKSITKFNFKVNIKKNIYLKMIKQRYISTLLKFSSLQISNGINEINLKYKKNILFNDKLKCIKIFKSLKNSL
jgi:ubiquinone/menaquinone biosynthesis C-methylase UbiE